MIKQSVTPQEVVDFLNELIEVDRIAIAALVDNRVPCNQSMADHPTVPVYARHEGYLIGMLGILNGMFGTDDDGWGIISSVSDGDGLLRFEALDRSSAEKVLENKILPGCY